LEFDHLIKSNGLLKS